MRKLYLDVVNLTAVNNTLLGGSLVYISGYDPGLDLYTIDYASYDDISKTPAVGILIQNTAYGSVGLVKLQGEQDGIDTSSVPPNTPVYLGLDGYLTFINPSTLNSSNFVQEIGIVGYQSVNGLVILQSSFSKGQAQSGGSTGNVTGTGLASTIAYWTSSSTLSYNNNLYWNNTNGQLGIGTTNPLSALSVYGGISVGTYAGANAAPTNGLIVSGSVGLGTPFITGDALTVGGATALAETIDPELTASYGKIYTKSDHNLYYLSATGTVTQLNQSGGSVISGSGTSGQATFWTASNVISGNDLFFWDNTNNKLALKSAVSNADVVTNNSANLQLQSSYFNGSNNVNANVLLQNTQTSNSVDSNQLDILVGDAGSEVLIASITQAGIQPASNGSASLGAFNSNSWSYVAAQNVYAQGIAGNIVTTTTNYNTSNTDCTILVDCTSGPVTITLVDATQVAIKGQIQTVKKIDSTSNAVTIVGTGSQLIDYQSSQSITNQYYSFVLQPDGTNWWIIAVNQFSSPSYTPGGGGGVGIGAL